MFRRLLFNVTVLFSIAGIVFLYYSIKLQKQPKINSIETILSESEFYWEADKFNQIVKKIRSENLIWEEFRITNLFPEIQNGMKIIDSLLESKNELKELLEDKAISCAGVKINSKTEIIYCIKAPDLNFEKNLEEIIKRNFKIESKKQSTEINVAHFSIKVNKNTEIHLVSKQGIVLLSPSIELLQQCFNCKKENSLASNDNFKTIYERLGSENDLHILFRNEIFETQTNQQLLKSKNKKLDFSLKIGKGWTGLDIQINTADISFSGFSKFKESEFLSKISEQEPVSIKFTDVLPVNCKNFAFLGISNYHSFSEIEIKDAQLRKQSDSINEDLGSNLKTEFEKIFGGEIVIARSKSAAYENYFGLISFKEKESTKEFLKMISITENDTLFKLKHNSLFEIISKEILIAKFNYAFLLEEYILFAFDQESIDDFNNSIKSNGVYSRSEYFERIKKCNLSQETNFYLHTEFSDSYSFIKDFFNKNVSEELSKLEPSFKKFNAAGIQLTNERSGILVQGYLLIAPSNRQNNFSIWECQLDTICSRPAQQVINHVSGSKEIFAQDESGSIYLLNNLGKILWKKKLTEKIKGKVHQIDFYKNEKLQLLFNTENYIHIIDRNGNNVNGYPLRIKEKASNPLSVFDYEKNKDYRVLLCGESGKIYNYKIQDSSLVEGFNFPLLGAPSVIPIEHFVISDKDYLLAIDRNGGILLTNRKGEVKNSISARLKNGVVKPEIFFGNSLDKTFLSNYDTQTKTIQKINLQGKEEFISVETENTGLFHKMEFINEDAFPDVIVADENGHEIIDELGKTILKFETKEELIPVVSVFRKNNITYFFQREVNGNLFISSINVDGTISQNLKKNRINCQSVPIISELYNDNTFYIITSVNNKLLCYSFDEN